MNAILATAFNATDLMERVDAAHVAGDLDRCADAGHDLAAHASKLESLAAHRVESLARQLEVADEVIATFVELLTARSCGLATELADELRDLLADPKVDGHDAYRSILETVAEAREAIA